MNHTSTLFRYLFVIMWLLAPSTRAATNTTHVETSTDTTGVVMIPDWKSDNKDQHSTQSALEVTFSVRRGTRLSFDWTASTEENYDIFEIYIGSEKIVQTSGIDGGHFERLYTKPGVHKLTAKYSKDHIASGNDDECTLTNIVLDHDAATGPDGLVPFRPTTITDGAFAQGTNWYNIQFGASKLYLRAEGDVVTNNDVAELDSAYYWAFVGNNTDGYEIYNMQSGPQRPLTATERTHKALITMGGEGDTRWRLTDSGDGFCFYMPGDTISMYYYGGNMKVYKPTTIHRVYNTSTVNRFTVVSKGQPHLAPIQAIVGPSTEVNIKEDKYEYLWYQLVPDNTVEREIECIAEDPTIVETYLDSEKGYLMLHGLRGGRTKVTLRSVKRPEVSTEFMVNVDGKILVEEIRLGADTAYMRVGDIRQIPIEVVPADAEDPTYRWTNTKPAVASISKDGLLYALAEGTTVLTAKANDKGGVSTKLTVIVGAQPDKAIVEHGERYLYALLTDSSLVAIPTSYVESHVYQGKSLSLQLTGGRQHVMTDVEALTEECPVELPQFASYKFNNKFNDQLFQDVIAEEMTLTNDTIWLDVNAIGKRLTASFQLADSLIVVSVDGKRQKSKYTRLRFDRPITYTIGRPEWKQLTLVSEGGKTKVEMMPYGRRTTVVVNWTAEHSTALSGLPRIIITGLGNGQWNSSNYIDSKTTYREATIKIEGGGAFPDMEETPILIKGRGNTSWNPGYQAKNPYHFKFDAKQKPLGMKAGKHWLLIANSQTGSMSTNAIAQRAAQMLGVAYANHIMPVELFINGSYRGSYNLTERIALANNSIDLANDSLAAVLELDTYTDEAIINEPLFQLPVKLKDAATDAMHADAAEAFAELTYAISKSSDYDGLIDIDRTGSYLLANELIANCELKHPKSVFLYNENIYDCDNITLTDPTPWVFGPVWDCDWAFGYQSGRSYFTSSATMSYFEDMGNSDNYWNYPRTFWQMLRNGSRALDRSIYSRFYHFMTMGGLDELCEYCQDYYDVVRRSYSHNKQNDTSSRDATDYKSQVAKAQTWLRQRAANMFSQMQSYDLSQDDDADEHPTDAIICPSGTQTGTSLVYDLSGRPVSGRLTPGIYIIGGKKIVVR